METKMPKDFKKIVINVLLNIYECIQNTIGFCEFKINKLKVNHKFKNSNIVYINYFDSHVWG